MDAGADMVELDVWRTTDGALVIYHDDRLPGHDLPVAKSAWSSLRHVALPFGARLPQLADALSLMRGHIPVNVEIKHGAALPDTLRLIRDLGMKDDIILSSFDLPAMYAAAELAPEIRRALIMGTESLAPCVRFREAFPFWALHQARAGYWHAGAPLVGPNLVSALHDQGVKVNVWTVNEPALGARLLGDGVDGLFTDQPGPMRRSLGLD